MVVCMHGSSAGAVMRAIPHPLSYETTVFLLALFLLREIFLRVLRFAQDNSPFTKEKRDLEGRKRQGPVIMSSEDYR